MTPIIVRADLETANKFNGKKAVAKVSGKKHNCLFRICVDDFNVREAIETASKDDNIIMLEYVGTFECLETITDFKGVYIIKKYELGMQFDGTDIEKIESSLPDGITPIIRLPETYNNIRYLCEIMEKHPRIRFCGGSCFCFDGYKFGCIGRDVLTKCKSAFDTEDYVHEGCCCALPTFDAEGLNLVSTSKSSVKYNNGDGTTKEKPAKQHKKEKFGGLLQGGKVTL